MHSGTRRWFSRCGSSARSAGGRSRTRNPSRPARRPRQSRTSRLGKVKAKDGQRTGQLPQNRCERDDRKHRPHGAEQQGATGSVGRHVGHAAAPGGEGVDVLLDALVGVVDGVIDEPAAVIGPATSQSTVRWSVNQTRHATMNRWVRYMSTISLRDVQRRQTLNTLIDIQKPSTPECLMVRVATCGTLERCLSAGEHVVALITEQHRQPDRHNERTATVPPTQPHPPRLRPDEVAAGDAPVLATPPGDVPQHYEHHQEQIAAMPSP